MDGIVNIKSKGKDVVTDHYYIECKYTDSKSFTVSEDVWKKIYWDAVRAGVEPLIAIKIKDIELIVMSIDYFKELDNGR